jgi:hypothetical protein
MAVSTMINFLEVERSVRHLQRQYVRGDIDEKTLEESLLELVDKAEDGQYWMFGHKTGRWYRHDGRQWVPRDPGELFVPLEQILSQDSLQTRWQGFSTGWFIVGLIILAIIAGIIFYSYFVL